MSDTCYLLEGLNINGASTGYSNGLKNESNNWEKELCRECPLNVCILEKKGLSGGDAIKFLKVLAPKFREVIRDLEDRIKENG